MSLLVFGSLNWDIVARVPRLPQAGETLSGRDFLQASGGKGANQAVAAARLETPTALVGRVGQDNFGRELLTQLHTVGVDVADVRVDSDTHTGVAIIHVDDAGENAIAIVPGANGRVDDSDVARLQPRLNGVSMLLLQLEIPLAAVTAAAVTARKAGVTVMLDPAPVPNSFPEDLYKTVDILTPNALEASQLLGTPVEDAESALAAAKAFRKKGVGTAIVTLGSAGVAYARLDEDGGEDTKFVPAFAVTARDTTAAGDAFNGAFAAAMGRGLSFAEALQWGMAAGALSATKAGAQPSLPDLATLQAALLPQTSA